MVSYLQLEQIEWLLRKDIAELDDNVHVLVRCILDHAVDALIKDPDIIKTGLRERDLRVLLADAHFLCVDEIIRHGFYPTGAPTSDI